MAESRAAVYGCGGRAEQVGRARRLAHAAEVHDRGPVGERPHDRQVVGDQQAGERQPLLEREQQREDLRLHGHVERGDRLVEDQQVGLGDEGPGDRRPLGLTAGQLAGQPLREPAGLEPDQVHDLGDAPPRVPPGR